MPGDLDALASRQAEIVADVMGWLPGVRVLVCPTYYPLTPCWSGFSVVCPRDTGPAVGTAGDADIFWTAQPGMLRTRLPGRISNTSARSWGGRWCCGTTTRSMTVRHAAIFLYLDKLPRREALPATLVAGHLCNPMNQGLLSLPALAGLGVGTMAIGQWAGARLEQSIGSATWKQLQSDRQAFQELGRSGMGEARCQALAERYRALPGSAAREVAGWLLGEYSFDPACLTD